MTYPFDNRRAASVTRRFFVAAAGCAALATAPALPAAAADALWPDKPITLVSPYAAGGPADILARALAVQLQKRLGTTVIVDNKPGGAATIGTGSVARARPDGQTLLIGTSAGHVVTPLMQKVPYDGIEDFDFIGVVANQPNLLVASTSLGVRSVAELLALARRQAAPMAFASAGNGGATHLGGELLQRRAGIVLTHIPYGGAAPALKDVLGGQVPLAVLNLGAVLPFVRDGKLVPLAYAGAKRSELLPDVPTLAEAGVRDAESSTWYTLAAPRGLPAPVREKLSAALSATLADPGFRELLVSQGAERVELSPERTRSFVVDDRRQMQALLGTIGLLAR